MKSNKLRTGSWTGRGALNHGFSSRMTPAAYSCSFPVSYIRTGIEDDIVHKYVIGFGEKLQARRLGLVADYTRDARQLDFHSRSARI